MKNILLALGLFISLLAPIQAQADTESKKESLYAITFHADWCRSCKALEPQMIRARGKYGLDNKQVLFVKLDMTDETTRHQSKLMASALGIEKFYQENNGKTGFVILVDGSTGSVVEKITKDTDTDSIASLIQEKLALLEK